MVLRHLALVPAWFPRRVGGRSWDAAGRRHPVELRAGNPPDFWRGEVWEKDRFLRLCAEIKVPGRAWLQFEVEPA